MSDQPNEGIAEYEAKRAREQTWYAGPPLIAFDQAAQQLLDAEPVEHLAGQIAKLRVLFMDELAQVETPRSQARPA